VFPLWSYWLQNKQFIYFSQSLRQLRERLACGALLPPAELASLLLLLQEYGRYPVIVAAADVPPPDADTT
jgi:hypothetical protein